MARANAYDKRFANATVWHCKKWEYANMVELNQDNNECAGPRHLVTVSFDVIG